MKVAELVKTKLKETFFVDNFQTENLTDPDTLKCSTQFCLNGSLSVNVGQLVVQAKSTRNGLGEKKDFFFSNLRSRVGITQSLDTGGPGFSSQRRQSFFSFVFMLGFHGALSLVRTVEFE